MPKSKDYRAHRRSDGYVTKKMARRSHEDYESKQARKYGYNFLREED